MPNPNPPKSIIVEENGLYPSSEDPITPGYPDPETDLIRLKKGFATSSTKSKRYTYERGSAVDKTIQEYLKLYKYWFTLRGDYERHREDHKVPFLDFAPKPSLPPWLKIKHEAYDIIEAEIQQEK